MNSVSRQVLLLCLLLAFTSAKVAGQQNTVALPPGIKVVWDLDRAHRDTTPTRERVCLNGLWRWQPATPTADAVPTSQWGYFKVPGFWPGTNNYIQEDSQALHVHPQWKNAVLGGLTAAWYQREFTVPKEWAGRRITLAAEYVNSLAMVHVDGKKVGELRFPAGEVDLTSACRPGGKHVLSLHVLALPLKGVLLSYSDTNSAKEVKGSVERRGLCGDVFLVSTPAAARISAVKVDTSVRKTALTISAALDGLAGDVSYTLRVQITEGNRVVRDFTSAEFRKVDLAGGRITLTHFWNPEKLWDIHTPQNQLQARVTLLGVGKAVDVAQPVRFGFREFWIEGRDFYLNGSRIYLSAVPLDNGQLGARSATYEGARDTFKRLKSFGINFVYTHNYGCQPGSHVSFTEILRAADDVGMLVGFSQPHFGHYEWKTPGADRDNGYARHAEFYVQAAQNHPAVVAYSMSHNATGYGEDMNPDMIATHNPREDTWSINNAKLAQRAEGIVRDLDPGRIVYHHSSGNLGSMHTCNFYVNFVPIQEMSDWFTHWSSKGTRPVFLCEYGVPFSWDWGMYRGWYRGERSFGSAQVPWEFCLAEWNAQFQGDRAYRISEREKQNLRFEAKQFRAGKLWHRWDYPHALGSRDFDERQEIFARYLTDNWRAFRTLGLSANSPWEYQVFWKLRDGVDRGRKELPVDWEQLQKPGFSPDYYHRQQWQMATDFTAADWIPTAAAQALLRNNRPLLAYIGGKAAAITSRDHHFLPGEIVEKQLIVINNTRETISCECEWSLNLPQTSGGSKKLSIRTGDQERVPLRFALPATLPPGRYQLHATVRFSTGETQSDSFAIDVLFQPNPVATTARIALLDPKGETRKILARWKVPFQPIQPNADLSSYDILIIGSQALTPDGPGPDMGRVRAGLRVIVFEQSARVLEERLGFRVAEYGLREVFSRLPDHPLLAGLKAEHLHDWRGEATLLPPRLKYTMRPRHGPTVQWCGMEVSRAWRCGCRGNVASVLIEKPARGDFLPILDGGYALQYSPLLEYREGQGMVLFCQLDVTARTEADPAADALARNLLRYVSTWKPSSRRPAVYVGEPAGKKHLEASGILLHAYEKGKISRDRVLIVGPGGGRQLVEDKAAVGAWLKAGGHLLALGLDRADMAFLPFQVELQKQEHIATYFDAPNSNSLVAGISPADVHNRDPRQLPLVTGGAIVLGNGILAKAQDANIVFCQLVPWHFEHSSQKNLRRTFRRASCLVARLAGNLGVGGSTPLLVRFCEAVTSTERRWLEGLYLVVPEEWDDPYRFFRW